MGKLRSAFPRSPPAAHVLYDQRGAGTVAGLAYRRQPHRPRGRPPRPSSRASPSTPPTASRTPNRELTLTGARDQGPGPGRKPGPAGPSLPSRFRLPPSAFYSEGVFHEYHARTPERPRRLAYPVPRSPRRQVAGDETDPIDIGTLHGISARTELDELVLSYPDLALASLPDGSVITCTVEGLRQQRLRRRGDRAGDGHPDRRRRQGEPARRRPALEAAQRLSAVRPRHGQHRQRRRRLFGRVDDLADRGLRQRGGGFRDSGI